MSASSSSESPLRTLAIGDIHGCLTALDLILQEVAPVQSDLVITLGDHIDRGPDTRGVIERLLELKTKTQLVSLRGNHEIMMMKGAGSEGDYQFWLQVGGDDAIASYAPPDREGRLEDIPERHWQFIEEFCRPWYETETHIFVHAAIDRAKSLEEQNEYDLYWKKLDAWPQSHRSGKIVICGHTPQLSGLPLDRGHTIGLDTWVYGQGWLSCLDINTGEIVQANQAGETRRVHL